MQRPFRKKTSSKQSARTGLGLNRVLSVECMESRRVLSADFGFNPARLNAEGESPLQSRFTWSIVPDGTPIYACAVCTPQPSNLIERLDALFGDEANWLPLFERAVEAWDTVSAVELSREAHDDGAHLPIAAGVAGVRGDIRFGGTSVDDQDHALGYAAGTSIVLNTEPGKGSSNYTEIFTILTHEVGHALGLEHSFPPNGTKLMEEYLPGNVRDKYGFGPQFDDILQIQKIFGDVMEPNDTMFAAATLANLQIGKTSIDQLSIHGASDQDLFSFASTGRFVTVRAVPAGGSYQRGDHPQNDYQQFDALRQNTLRIELFDASGGLLEWSEASTAGELAGIYDFAVTTGAQYYVKVSGTGLAAQMYTLNFEIANSPLSDQSLQQGDMAWLAAQIEAANALNLPTRIDVPAGRYLFTQPIRINANVELVGTDERRTVFDGQRQTRLFMLDGAGHLALQRLTLMRGFTEHGGGAIWSFNADVTLRNVVLLENVAQSHGGAVAVSAGSRLTLESVRAHYNQTDGGGGAIHSNQSTLTVRNSILGENRAAWGGAVATLGTTRITGSQISRNVAQSIGGGIAFERTAATDFELVDSWITENRSDYGGGLNLGGLERDEASTLIRVHIDGNQANFAGGGLRLAGTAQVQISDSLIMDNSAHDSAGISIGEEAELSVHRSWIRRNTAEYISGGVGGQGKVAINQSTISENVANLWFGGGIGLHDDAELLLINSTVSLNRANSDGAGIAAHRAEILHSTIAFNYLVSALPQIVNGQGAGLQAFNTAVVTNSIIAKNGTGGSTTDAVGRLVITHSFLGAVDEETAELHRQNGNIVGTAAEPIDPLISELSANGGPTPTHRLLTGSPGIDAGIALGGIRHDQRQVVRGDGRPDMGAYESARSQFDSNSPPTIEIVPDLPLTNTELTSISVQLSGLSDGDGGRQPLAIRASSSNLAVIRSVDVGPIDGDQALLQLNIVPGTAGTSLITVEASDPGMDRVFGTIDDLSLARDFEVTIVNGRVIEAESVAGDIVERPTASAGRTHRLAANQRLALPLSLSEPRSLDSISVRYLSGSMTSDASAQIRLNGVDVGVVTLLAASAGFSVTTTDANLLLPAGESLLELVLLDNGMNVELDQVSLNWATAPLIIIDDSFVLEPQEGQVDMEFRLYLSSPVDREVTVRLQTQARTAQSPADYVHTDAIVVFLPGETVQHFRVPVNRDNQWEPSETFVVAASDAVGATLYNSSAIGTIYDNPFILGSPVLPSVRPMPRALPTIYIVINPTGPTVLPPRLPVPPFVFPPVQRILASVFRRGDVNRDGRITPLDILQLINHLNSRSSVRFASDVVDNFDVNRDGRITPLDILLIINHLNAVHVGSGEGEDVSATQKLPGSQLDALRTSISAFDTEAETTRKRRQWTLNG